VFSKKIWEIALVLACAFLAVTAAVWTADPDVFWHLKVGEWIVQNRAVPETDVYSWSAFGKPWTDHEWLWEALIYLLHAKLGVVGLWLPVFVSAAGAGLLVRAGLLSCGTDGAVSSFAGGLAPLLLGGWLKPWPQAGVYALFSAYLYLSLKGKWGKKEFLATFALGALWANVHSSAVLLPLLFAAEAVFKCLCKKDPGRLLAAALASAAGTLLNPHGAGLWIYAVREGLATREYRECIAEWMPFYFGDAAMAGAFFVSAAVLLLAAKQDRVGTLTFVRAAGFWLLALLSRIYVPFAALSTAALAGMLGTSFKEWAVKAGAVLMLVFGIALTAVRGLPADLDAAAERARFPVKAVEFLKGQEYARLFNDYGFGGYLIFKGVPVYIDGRADLYRSGIFKRYVGISNTDEKMSSYIEGTGADAALLLARSPADRAMMESTKWECIYRDGAAAVYFKKR
jgi:hypothetical protein